MKKISLLQFFMIVLVCALPFQAAMVQGEANPQNNLQPDTKKTWFLSFIESKLSDPNRQIRISNIDGVLSSQVSVGLITVADREGIWLRINSAKLNWNRLALLAGRVSINSLSAERIEVLRRPLPQQSAPQPEAGSFSLPALPVAVIVDSLHTRQILFDEQLLGVGLLVSLDGHLTLSGGALSSRFDINRLDGSGGTFKLVTDYSNNKQHFDLELSEPANGIAAGLLKIENRPPVNLLLKGDGTLDNLDADLVMNAADHPVLNGRFSLRAGEGSRAFSLIMNGPVASLMPEIYRPFFGQNTKLDADGVLQENGGLRLDKLLLEGDAVHISGQAETAPDGFLRQLRIDARIASQGTGSLVLPVRGGKTAAKTITFNLAYGMPGTDSWTGKLTAHDLAAGNLQAGNLTLEMGGPAENLDDPANRHIGITLKGGVDNITSQQKEISAATGSHIDVNMDADWSAGSPLVIKTVNVNAERLALFIRGQMQDFVFQGNIAAKADSLAPFSELVSRPLAGRADLKISGRIGFTDGTFDVNLDGVASGLHTGIAAADRFFKDEITLSGGVGRDTAGIHARSLRVGSKAAEITADGHFASETADMNFGLWLSDLALADPELQGPLVLQGAARGRNSLIAIGVRSSVMNGTWRGRKLANTIVSFNGVLDSTSPITRYSGMAKGSGLFGGEKLALSFAFHTDNNQTALDGLDIVIGNVKLSGSLVRNSIGLIDGKLHLDAADISAPAALCFMEGKGAAYVDIVLDAQSGKQNAAINADINKLDIAGIRLAAFRMQAALYDLFGVPKADGTLDGSAIHVAGYDIKSVHAASEVQNQNSQITAGVELEDSTAITVTGILSSFETDGWQLLFDKAGLRWQTINVALLRQAKLTLRKNGDIGISDVALNVGNGSIAVDGTVADTVNLVVDAKKLPLAIANLVRPDLGLEGTVSGTANIFGNRAAPDIAFDIAATGVAANLLHKNGIAPLDLKASGKTTDKDLDLNAHLSGGELDIAAQGHVFITQQKLDLEVSLKDTPLSVLNSFVKNQNLGGVVTGSAHISGGFTSPAIKFSVEGSSLDAKLLASNGLAPLHLFAEGSYGDHVLNLGGFTLTGPKDMNIKASGRLPVSGSGLDLRINGSVPLALANRFLADRGSQFSGLLTVNAMVGGSFTTPRLNGGFSVTNGQFIDPELNVRLNTIIVAGKFNGEQVVLERASANSASGGSLGITGWVSTSVAQDLPANLTINLSHTRYSDGNMLIASVDGKIIVTGPLMRDPEIAGNILIEKAEIHVPDSFGSTSLIEVRHRHLTPPIATMLGRAHVQNKRSYSSARTTRQLMPKLNLLIRAPNQIFVRGRGLDVELHGQLQLVGSAADIQPVGGFSMLHGQFDILTQRLTFREGQITMTGNLNPELNFVARTDGNDITVTVQVSGTPQDLDVTFKSQPELPQDEVLARLIFKRSVSELSPFQIAQLMDATAELAGVTSRSIFGSLRIGSSLDKLNVFTDALGNVGVEAGRYIQNNLYLGLETAAGGESKGTVNLDISKSLKAKGAIGSDSSSNVGVFYEKDY